MCLGVSNADKEGKLSGLERWTNTLVFGLFVGFVDNKKNID